MAVVPQTAFRLFSMGRHMSRTVVCIFCMRGGPVSICASHGGTHRRSRCVFSGCRRPYRRHRQIVLDLSRRLERSHNQGIAPRGGCSSGTGEAFCHTSPCETGRRSKLCIVVSMATTTTTTTTMRRSNVVHR